MNKPKSCFPGGRTFQGQFRWIWTSIGAIAFLVVNLAIEDGEYSTIYQRQLSYWKLYRKQEITDLQWEIEYLKKRIDILSDIQEQGAIHGR